MLFIIQFDSLGTIYTRKHNKQKAEAKVKAHYNFPKSLNSYVLAQVIFSTQWQKDRIFIGRITHETFRRQGNENHFKNDILRPHNKFNAQTISVRHMSHMKRNFYERTRTNSRPQINR